MTDDVHDPATAAKLREKLSPEAYHVTCEHGTERPFSHPSYKDKTPGIYACVVCGTPLFDAATKFDSGTGWPSFYKPVSDAAVSEHTDRSLMMTRTEVTCAKCAAHLGHVFPDGPNPTGLRYCMNGVAMKLMPDKDKA